MSDRTLLRFAALVFILFLALSVACSGETEEDDDDDDEGRIAPVGAVVTVDVSTDDDLHLAV
jgi:hypothetical protein